MNQDWEFEYGTNRPKSMKVRLRNEDNKDDELMFHVYADEEGITIVELTRTRIAVFIDYNYFEDRNVENAVGRILSPLHEMRLQSLFVRVANAAKPFFDDEELLFEDTINPPKHRQYSVGTRGRRR